MKKYAGIVFTVFSFYMFLGVATQARAEVINLNLTLSTAETVSGFKIAGSTLEWLDINTFEYNIDSSTYNAVRITDSYQPATDGFRLASYEEWLAVIDDLLIDGFSVDEHKIIGGIWFTIDPDYFGTVRTSYGAYGLIISGNYYGGTTDSDGAGVIMYASNSSPTSVAWVSDSWDYYDTTAWLVRESNPVPEPSTILLLGFGLVCLARFRKKRFFKN